MAFESLLSRRRFARQFGSCLALAACSPMHAFTAPGLVRVTTPSSMYWDPLHFGARGDGVTKDTAALQRTVESCAAAGGGIVVLRPGHTFLSGTIVLKPHVEFHIAGGSTLLASPNRDDFRAMGSLLFAKDASDIHVSGTGTINGNFAAFFPPKGPDGYPVPEAFLGPYDPLDPPSDRNPPDGRPRMILLVHCRSVLLEQFTIVDSPTWTIHPLGCEGVHITGLSILNSLDIPNCDGIDIDHCRNVRVEGCNITAGDDCLIVKASRNFGEYGPCEGVTITNCTLESSSAGIKIEAEGPYPVRSAIVSNCTIVRSNRGISFLNRDGATVEDLLFTDLTIETKMRTMMWWGSGEPIAVSSVPRAKGGPAGLVRGIQFVNIQARGESGIYLRGAEGAPLTDLTFRSIDLSVAKTTDRPGGYYDMRPGDAFGESGLDRRPTAGFFATAVDGLQLDGVHIHWPGRSPAHYGSALELHDCRNVSLAQVSGVAAHPGQPASIIDTTTYTTDITPDTVTH